MVNGVVIGDLVIPREKVIAAYEEGLWGEDSIRRIRSDGAEAYPNCLLQLLRALAMSGVSHEVTDDGDVKLLAAGAPLELEEDSDVFQVLGFASWENGYENAVWILEKVGPYCRPDGHFFVLKAGEEEATVERVLVTENGLLVADAGVARLQLRGCVRTVEMALDVQSRDRLQMVCRRLRQDLTSSRYDAILSHRVAQAVTRCYQPDEMEMLPFVLGIYAEEHQQKLRALYERWSGSEEQWVRYLEVPESLAVFERLETRRVGLRKAFGYTSSLLAVRAMALAYGRVL